MAKRPGWIAFLNWTVAAAILTFALLAAPSIGLFVLPVALIVFVLVARTTRVWPECLGILAGAGVILLFVAFLNRNSVHSPPAMGKFGEVALAHPRFVWDSIRTARFTLYVPRSSYAAARATQYEAEVGAGIDHALAILGERLYPAHLQVFVMGSREDVEAVTGVGWSGWADPAGHNVAVVARPECRPVFKHEIMHAVSLVLWGNPLGPDKDPYPPKDSVAMEQGGWLREGIAAAAEDLYVKYWYRGMAAQWLAEGTIFPLDTLVNRFYQVDDLAAYLQSGSLVNYLLEQYGKDRFLVVWRDGASAFERAYGRSFSQIESEWHTWLRATPASARPKSIAIARSENRCPPRRK